MSFYLLTDNFFAAGLFIAGFAILTVLAEAFILFLFKYSRFGKCVSDSLLVNVGSFLFLVFILWLLSHEELDEKLLLAGFYFISCLLEAGMLKLLNRSLSWKKILPAGFLMNVPVTIVIYLFLTMGITV